MQEMIKITSKNHPNIEIKGNPRTFCNAEFPYRLLFGYDDIKNASERGIP